MKMGKLLYIAYFKSYMEKIIDKPNDDLTCF